MATKKQSVSAPQKEESLKLEDAMRRLDQVVAALDSDKTDLDEAMKLYEEGVGLVRLCHRKLQEAERTVRILQISEEGEITEKAFDVEQGE